jgi:CheY-like chemotaxis protein
MSGVSSLARNSAPVSVEAPTILVVEDEILIRAMLTDALRDHGYTVIEAASADEAFSILRGLTPVDLVVTDMRMPGALDGAGLVQLIRTEFPLLKVIMVSGQPPDADVHTLLDGYLPKPAPISTLTEYLRRLIPSCIGVQVS